MPRPATVTQEQLTRWGSRLNRGVDDINDFVPVPKEIIEEVGYAGSWLGEQLALLPEISEEESQMTRQAAGQIMVGRDPWDVAAKILEDAQKGLLYRSGSGLAQALVQGELDNRFGPGADFTPGGIQKLLEVHGASSLSDLIAKLMTTHNCSSIEELQAKVNEKVKETDERFGFGRDAKAEKTDIS